MTLSGLPFDDSDPATDAQLQSTTETVQSSVDTMSTAIQAKLTTLYNLLSPAIGSTNAQQVIDAINLIRGSGASVKSIFDAWTLINTALAGKTLQDVITAVVNVGGGKALADLYTVLAAIASALSTTGKDATIASGNTILANILAKLDPTILTAINAVTTAANVGASARTDYLVNGTTQCTVKQARVNPTLALGGNSQVVAAVTGKSIKVVSAIISATLAGSITFTSNSGGTALKSFALALGTPIVLPFNPYGYFATNSGQALYVTEAVAATLDISVSYVEV